MITKPFLKDVDNFGRAALACKEAVYQDYLGVEIGEDGVNHTIYCKKYPVHISASDVKV